MPENINLGVGASLSKGLVEIGVVTSCGFSNWLQKTIGFAHIKTNYTDLGQELIVNIGGIKKNVRISDRRSRQDVLLIKA